MMLTQQVGVSRAGVDQAGRVFESSPVPENKAALDIAVARVRAWRKENVGDASYHTVKLASTTTDGEPVDLINQSFATLGVPSIIRYKAGVRVGEVRVTDEQDPPKKGISKIEFNAPERGSTAYGRKSIKGENGSRSFTQVLPGANKDGIPVPEVLEAELEYTDLLTRAWVTHVIGLGDEGGWVEIGSQAPNSSDEGPKAK